jgi:hypothetical protein
LATKENFASTQKIGHRIPAKVAEPELVTGTIAVAVNMGVISFTLVARSGQNPQHLVLVLQH